MFSISSIKQRVTDNETPASERGSKWGYVRREAEDGSGSTWYPAYFSQTHKSTGIFSKGEQEMRLNWGSNLLMKRDAQSNWVPTFTDGGTESFIVNEIDLSGFMSQKGYIETRQMTKDWYFLDADETKGIIQGMQSGKKDEGFVPYQDDYTDWNQYELQVDGWRRATQMDFNRKWANVALKDRPDNDGARQFYAQYAESPDYITAPYQHNFDGSDPHDMIHDNVSGEDGKGTGKPWTKETWRARTQTLNNPWEHSLWGVTDWMLNDKLVASIRELYQAQKIAAKEQGFEQTFSTDQSRQYYSRYHRPGKNIPTLWSSMYLDTAKDLPTAITADQLQKQYDAIAAYDDRTMLQKNYLAQKAQVRFWQQQMADIGGGGRHHQNAVGRRVLQPGPKTYENVHTKRFDRPC